MLKNKGFGTHSFPAKKIPDISNTALHAEHACSHMHALVLESINCLCLYLLETQVPAAISTKPTKIRKNVPVLNARKLWCVCVHTGGSVRNWLVRKKSKLMLQNIIFSKPVCLFIRTCPAPGRGWQLGQALQQCPSTGSRVWWGRHDSAGTDTSGIRTGFLRCFSRLSAREAALY